MTNIALRSVPDDQEEEEDNWGKNRDLEKDIEEDNWELHPNVEPYLPFKYVPGKPDRVKKSQRFFRDEEMK